MLCNFDNGWCTCYTSTTLLKKDSGNNIENYPGSYIILYVLCSSD